MKENNAATEKLRRILEVWEEIQKAKEGTPEYERLLEQCGVLSAEYQALVDAADKEESK